MRHFHPRWQRNVSKSHRVQNHRVQINDLQMFFRVSLPSGCNTFIFPNRFHRLYITLGSFLAHFGRNFHKKCGRQGPGSEKWIPKAAYRRRMALVMQIISACVRPKRVRKQQTHIVPTCFACKDGPEHSKSTRDYASRDHFWTLWGHFWTV